MKPYKSEIEITETGVYLCIENTLRPEDEKALIAVGYRLLTNGTSLDFDPSIKALYFFKPFNA